jgi:DUF2934 family protein
MTKVERVPASNVSRTPVVAGSSSVESPVPFASAPTADEQIRMRAYELYRERGGRVGDDMADWLQAEREYLERTPKPTADPTGHGVSESAPDARP